MAEFTIVSQWIDSSDPEIGQIAEELRTLQVKRAASAVQRKQERSQWQRFGACKGKTGPERGITDVLKEDIRIEEPSSILGSEDDDKIAQRLVSSAGKMTISGSGLSRYNSASKDGASSGTHSRRGSGTINAGEESKDRPRRNSGGSNSGHSRSNSGSILPPPPGSSPSNEATN
jgi:hypothetical protein